MDDDDFVGVIDDEMPQPHLDDQSPEEVFDGAGGWEAVGTLVDPFVSDVPWASVCEGRFDHLVVCCLSHCCCWGCW